MTVSASAEVDATPQQVLEFVVDLTRYRVVDPKIWRVRSVTGPDAVGRGSVAIWGRMKGLPPAPDRQDFTLERWDRITFVGARRQPARLVFDFTGTVECRPSGGRTTVVHAYEFRFHGPFRPVERLLSGWLQRQIDEELVALAAIFAQPSLPRG